MYRRGIFWDNETGVLRNLGRTPWCTRHHGAKRGEVRPAPLVPLWPRLPSGLRGSHSLLLPSSLSSPSSLTRAFGKPPCKSDGGVYLVADAWIWAWLNSVETVWLRWSDLLMAGMWILKWGAVLLSDTCNLDLKKEHIIFTPVILFHQTVTGRRGDVRALSRPVICRWLHHCQVLTVKE
jgi:hypothetical protein